MLLPVNMILDDVMSNESHLFAINLNVSHIVLEYGGDVHLRELVLAEHDQQAGFTAGSVSNDHQLFPDSGHV